MKTETGNKIYTKIWSSTWEIAHKSVDVPVLKIISNSSRYNYDIAYDNVYLKSRNIFDRLLLQDRYFKTLSGFQQIPKII